MAESAEKKANFFDKVWHSLYRFFREIKSEIKKIIWPSPKEIYNGTVITLASIFIIGIFIWVLGWLLNNGLTWLLNR